MRRVPHQAVKHEALTWSPQNHMGSSESQKGNSTIRLFNSTSHSTSHCQRANLRMMEQNPRQPQPARYPHEQRLSIEHGNAPDQTFPLIARGRWTRTSEAQQANAHQTLPSHTTMLHCRKSNVWVVPQGCSKSRNAMVRRRQ